MDKFSIFLPLIIMTESFTAGIIYSFAGKPGQAIYWFAAGVLNFAVIFLIPGER
ncbi:MAG: hypothetical protein HN597_14955 [Desulfobacula sp.]|jgi:hypothetical protein|uniref:Uncharacterized protein n=1 Tax=uncultured marine virus TaxID=186617 RepID=A0A0F7L6A3_9VIRU|nr:hypothetical protein [uncultured marine virus]MBT7630982.1 hypothetical protein [Desulfobacula sp.]